jgi:hypothetical protein
MKLISHRGNINGKNPERENHPDYILEAINAGYDVEIDIWYKTDGNIYLGHDNPQYKIDLDHEIFNLYSPNGYSLEGNALKLWIHCKNIPAIHYLSENRNHLNYFFHDLDECTLTSKGYIWTYPGYSLGTLGKPNNSICVLPETVTYEEYNCYGICSDVIEKYKEYEKIK